MSDVLLGDYVDTLKGFAFKSKWFEEVGTPIIKVTNFTDDSVSMEGVDRVPSDIAEKYRRYELLKDDVVVQTVGSWPSNPASVVGKTVRVPAKANKALLNQNAVMLKPKEALDKSYLFYLLKTETFKSYIVGTAQGAASQASITLEAIRGFKFRCPSIEEQQKVARVLRNYDDLIENNNRRITILETIAQNLYREWFISFRFPGHEQTQWQETPQGKIPRGWQIKRLDDFLVLQRGFDLPKRKRNEEGNVPIYAASGINGFHDEIKAKAPGVVTGRSGTLGVVNLVLEDYWPLNTALWVREFKNCSAYYAYYLLSSIELERFNSGASVPTLNRNDVHGLEVIAPPQKLIERFEEQAELIHSLIKNLVDKNKNLTQQRDMLLPKLTSNPSVASNT